MAFTTSQTCPRCRRVFHVDDVRSAQAPCPECGYIAGADAGDVSDTVDAVNSDVDVPTGAYASQFDLLPSVARGVSSLPRIPGYEVLALLGEGGMGCVFKARHLKLNRIVALKMIGERARVSGNFFEQFQKEAEAVATFQHPNIVQIHEIGAHAGLPYFTLEYMGGGSLQDKLQGVPQEPRASAHLVETIARAMHYAHQRRIIHRDLKPLNVLLSSPHSSDGTLSGTALGPYGVPKVADFGLAKLLPEEADQAETQVISGTPPYMAPEQASHEVRLIGPGTDVYALGAILYEMLTGRPPFRGKDALDTLDQVRTQEPVPPSQLQPNTPRDLETICLKCLQKEPAKRYASAEALAEDLRRFQHDEPIQARPIGRLERGWRWCRRNPDLAAACSLSALALVAVTLGAIAFAMREMSNAETIGKAFTELEEKNTLLGVEKGKTVAALKEVQKSLAESELDRGLGLCEQDEEARGLLWLARSLKDTPPEERELRQVIGATLNAWTHQVHPLRMVVPHSYEVRAVAFSPDSKTLLTGSDTARLWDAATGKPLGPPLGYRSVVPAVAFSPDGKTLLTGSGDGTARLWDAATGKPLCSPLPHKRGVGVVAFSPTGNTVVTGSDDNTARVWDAVTGKPIGEPLTHRSWIRAIAFSHDGKTVLTGSWDKTARLWDAATGKPLGTPLTHQGGVVGVAFSPDDRTVVTGSDDRTARLWDAATGKPLGTPLTHQGRVKAVAFSPDGKSVLTGSWDKTARLWDAVAGTPLTPPLTHQGGISSVAFSPDGKRVLTGSYHNSARLWDSATGKPLGQPLMHLAPVVAVAFSPDGKTVMAGSEDATARLWDAATGNGLGSPLEHQGSVKAAVLSPDGRMLVTAGWDGKARRWDAATGKPLDPPLAHQGPVVSAAFSPDGKTILTGSHDKTARLWDAESGKPLGPSLVHQGLVVAVAVSPDGKTLLTGSEDKTARLWDAASGKPIGPPLAHKDKVVAVAFSPDGKTVMTGSHDGTAHLWDAGSGKPLGSSLAHGGWVTALAFSPDARTILTGGRGKSARLWDAATGQPLGQLEHQGQIRAAAFSPDGKTILTGSHDKTARLWDAATLKPLGPPLPHQDQVWVVAFSSDGKILVSGSEDKTARLWDAATLKSLGPPLTHHGEVWAAAFSPDGKTILTGSEDRTVRRWTVPAPIPDDAEHIEIWVQVITGMELKEGGAVRVFDAEAWHERKRRLDERGGPPRP